nr:uncharacterized protein LOC109999859 isoform X2 [Labrus bergylta]
MTSRFRGIKMLLLGILMLLLTVTGEDVLSFTVRVGDDVTLPCGRVTEDQPNCDQITWLFNRDIRKTAVELVTNGDLIKNAKAEAERLNVSEDCSLVIKNVTPQDVGLYTCRQFRSGEQHGPEAKVSLSVINVESHGLVFFICSVSTYSECWHSVEWLYKGHMKDTETTQRTCSANVSFPSPLPDQKSNLDESLYCNVTDVRSGQTLRLNVRHQSLHEETVSFTGLLRFIIFCVLLAALIIIVVAVNIWSWTKENKPQTDPNAVQNDEDEDEDDGSVVYENSGGHDASIGNQ